VNYAARLREELRERALSLANGEAKAHYFSLGDPGTLLFEPTSDGLSHGNFHAASYAAIAANPLWALRLKKRHSQRASLPVNKAAAAMELDSSNSSDALLMNCFCYPGAAEVIFNALDIKTEHATPEFGYKARLPLKDGTEDATEVDMRVGDNLFEAKLTEKDFTARPKAHVLRYCELETVFNLQALPTVGGNFTGYQLIRNVLAAAHHQTSFFLLIDQRRPDLLQEWWRIHAAIRGIDLRLRCGFHTWQEIAAVCPRRLAGFLAAKYCL
jgi:hypothetical protein